MAKTTVSRLIIGLLVLHSVAYLAFYAQSTLVSGGRLGGDFPTFWRHAALAISGAAPDALYDIPTLQAQTEGTLDMATDPLPPFPYPPPLLVFLLPLGALAYHAALALWLALGAGAFVLAVRGSPFWAGAPTACRAGWLLLSPFALYNLVTAQNGFFTAALLVAAIAQSRVRPYVAGICAGLLCIKPQLALMLPVLFLAQRNARALLAAAATALLLCVDATMLFGFAVWPAYAEYLRAFAHMLQVAPGILTQMNASLYRSLVMGGFAPALALAVHLVVVVACSAATFFAARSPDSALRLCVILLASLLASPHLMTYDMPAIILPAMYLLSQFRAGTERPFELLAVVFLLFSPIMALHSPHVPLAFVAMLSGLFLLARRLHSVPQR